MITLQAILTVILFAMACSLLHLSSKVNTVRVAAENELSAARALVRDISLREENVRVASEELTRTQEEFISAIADVRIQAYRHGIGSAVGAIEYMIQSRADLTPQQIIALEGVADDLRVAMDPHEMLRRLNS